MVMASRWYELPMVKLRMNRGDDHDDIKLVECPECENEVYFDHKGRTQVCSACGNLLTGMDRSAITVGDALERDARAHHG